MSAKRVLDSHALHILAMQKQCKRHQKGWQSPLTQGSILFKPETLSPARQRRDCSSLSSRPAAELKMTVQVQPCTRDVDCCQAEKQSNFAVTSSRHEALNRLRTQAACMPALNALCIMWHSGRKGSQSHTKRPAASGQAMHTVLRRARLKSAPR